LHFGFSVSPYLCGRLESLTMPELPEVETIVRTLRPMVTGARITGVEVRRRAEQSLIPVRILVNPVAKFRERVCGSLIEAVERYGKHIVLRLRSETSDA